jgi:hypothetical protein
LEEEQSMKKLSAVQTQILTKALDRVATLIEGSFAEIGLSDKEAQQFVTACDKLADRAEKVSSTQKKASLPLPSEEEAPVVKLKGNLPAGCEVRLYRKSGPTITYLVGKDGQAVGMVKFTKPTQTDFFPYLAVLGVGRVTKPIGAFWAPKDWDFIGLTDKPAGYPDFKGGLFEAARLICAKS